MFDPQAIDIMRYVPPLVSGVQRRVPKVEVEGARELLKQFFADKPAEQTPDASPPQNPDSPPSQGPDTPLEGPNG